MLPLSDEPIQSEPDPLDVIAADRNIAVLDEELNRLPEKYRSVLVMTYFGSQSSQQIADQLSESKGVIDGRLRQARNVLRIRLARRGVQIGAVTAAAALMDTAAAATSSSLIESTISLGADCLGHPVPSPVDISRLEPLIKPEFALMSAKSLTMLVACLAFIAGAAGISQIPFASANGSENGSVDAAAISASLPAAELPQPKPTEVVVAAKSISVTNPVSALTADNLVLASKSPASPPSKAQYAGFSSSVSREVAERIYQQLEQESPDLDFPGEVSLEEVLNQIADHVSTTTNTKLKIVPDYAQLELEGINSLAEVQVKDVVLKGLTLRSALDLIFSQTKDPDLDFLVKNEVLIVTTRDEAESDENLFNRYYNVTKHLNLYAPKVGETYPGLGGGGFGRGGAAPAESAPAGSAQAGSGQAGSGYSGSGQAPIRRPVRYELSELNQLLMTVQDLTAPSAKWFDVDSEGGRMQGTGSILMVRQSRRGHLAVAEILEQLEEAADRLDTSE